MLLSKLNSVGAIFISCPEAADVIRRIARRESVAKGRERFTLLLQPSHPTVPSSSFLSSIALLTRLSVYVCTLSTISPYSNQALHTRFSFFLMSARSFLRLKYLAPFAISVALYINAHPNIAEDYSHAQCAIIIHCRTYIKVKNTKKNCILISIIIFWV